MKNAILSFALGLILMLPTMSFAQKELSLDESVMGRWGNLSPERLSNFKWIPDTEYYTYTEKSDQLQSLVKVHASNFNKEEIINTTDLAAQLLLKKVMVTLPNFNWISSNEAYFMYSGLIYKFNAKSKKAKKYHALPKGAANFTFRPGTADLAFTMDNNLYLLVNGREEAITHHTDANIVAGQTVSRVEFGIEQGIIWNKTGTALAFYEKDETHVTNYPLVDYSTRPASVKNTKYPMAGMPSEEVRIGMYSLKDKEVIYLNSKNAKESYLTSVSWDRDEKSIYAASMNRGQDTVTLKQYDCKTGDWKKDILTETDPEYVHPTHGLTFIGKGEFLWQSENEGINQFYVYNVAGNSHWKVNTENILVRKFLSYDEATQKLCFLGNDKDKIDLHLFEVTITDGGSSAPVQITTGDSYYAWASISSNKKFALTRSSSLTKPNSYDLIELAKKSVSNLMTSDNPLKEYEIGETKLGTIKANDGSTILHTRTVYPHDFDENKKYPVLIYVYNGPGVQLIHANWLASASLWMYHFANKGYIVFTLDGRGSTNRGIEFEQAIFRNLGQVEMQDQLSGIDYLKSLNYVDGNRIGVHGWSYGGFMTTSLLTSYPGTFKVGVAGGPVMDWSYYEVMYAERYMDTPETNKEGFELTSNIKRAKNLKDPLLIIHGAVDPTVVKQNSDLFLKECIKNGIQVDFFEYPGAEHNVRGKDRVHLMQKVLDYVERHL
ncbi:MAG: dipeptidyl-peptidase-4 [Salibacteraceae bacterium]|jgi:dipeptidyl-peptidase-4